MSAPNPGSVRAAALADRLIDSGEGLIGLIERIDPADWVAVPGPGVWSPSKDAQHVAEGNVLHQWNIRFTIGESTASRRPPVERKQLTSTGSRTETVDLIRQTLGEAAGLIRRLTDAQLDLPTKPPKAGAPSLAQSIQDLMIDHVEHHRAEIEAKLGGTRANRRR